MKHHIEAGYGGGKEATRIAFATVNKYRARHGKTKKSRRRKRR